MTRGVFAGLAAGCSTIHRERSAGNRCGTAWYVHCIDRAYMRATTFTLLALVGCAGESDPCGQATDALASCGQALEESPFGTCQAEQRSQAEQLLQVYDNGGCPALLDAKADSPTCSALPFLCVDHFVNELAAFSTDGCSMFPDGTAARGTLWQECCVTHDFAYYIGGASELREAADAALGACVAQKTGSSTFGELMRLGVRIGGTPLLPTPWRWGYGWKYDPLDGYRTLPADQATAATAQVDRYRAAPWPPHAIEQRLRELASSISKVPGLQEAIDKINAKIAELKG